MGAATAVAIGAAASGAIIQSENAKKAAKSAGDAANAQAAEAGRQRDMIMQQANENQRLAMSLAEATPQELANLDRSYQEASNNLDRESRLLAAIDPAMMEASKQALGLLRGENAGITQAMQQQRQMQRSQLVNQLRAQYGPGAETSSVGMKALQSFDMQSNMMTQQANQGALSQLFGMANTDAGARMRAGIGQFQQVGQGYSALRDRKLNTQVNTGNGLLNALSGTSSGMIQAAGAPYVQGTMQAQADAALGGNLMQAGLTYGMMNMGGGAKPTGGGTAPTGGGGIPLDGSGAGSGIARGARSMPAY